MYYVCVAVSVNVHGLDDVSFLRLEISSLSIFIEFHFHGFSLVPIVVRWLAGFSSFILFC